VCAGIHRHEKEMRELYIEVRRRLYELFLPGTEPTLSTSARGYV